MKNFIFSKQHNKQINYNQLAEGIFFFASVLFFASIFLAIFPPEIVTRATYRLSNGYYVWVEKDIDGFANYWFKSLTYGMMMLSAFSALLFIKLWQQFYANFSKKDFALFWFALAMLSWAVAGICKIAGVGNWLLTVLSQTNNLFFILSLPYFKYGYQDIIIPIFRRIGIRDENFAQRVCLFFLLISPSYLPVFNQANPVFWWENIGGSLNFVLSCFMGLMLLVVLWASFEQRGLRMIKWLSLIPILALLIGEVLYLFYPIMPEKGLTWHISGFEISYDKLQTKVVIAFLLSMWKVMLMVLVAGLAMSWLYEKIETQRREMTHLVKNGLHQFLLDVEDEKNTQSFPKEMMSRVKNLRDFVENVFLERGDANIYLRPFLDDTLRSLRSIFQFEPIWDFSALEGIRSYGDSARDLGKLITELILNAYKYGGKAAKIRASVEEEQLVIMIADEGNPEFDFKPPKPEGKGLGMKLFHIYLEALNGSFKVIPEPKASGKTLILNFSLSTFTQ